MVRDNVEGVKGDVIRGLLTGCQPEHLPRLEQNGV